MAATDLATLRVNVIASTRDFKRGMQDVRRETKSIGAHLRDIGRNAVVFTAAATGAGWAAKKLFDLGAAVEETGSKYRTVFGPAIGEVNAFLAQNARLLGLTDREAQDVVATTGAIVQGMGLGKRESAAFSVEIARLAGDFASFNNIPIEETSRAIQAALTGERESLKRLGVVILETDVQERALINTGKANVRALTQQEKAYASLQIIRERAGVQVGDLNRTQESAANVFRRVAASARQFRDDIAVGLLPAMSVLLDIAVDGEGKLAKWGQTFRQHANIIAAWVRVVLTGLDAVGQALTNIQELSNLAGQFARNMFASLFSSGEEYRRNLQEGIRLKAEMAARLANIGDLWDGVKDAIDGANNAARGAPEGGLFGPDGIVLNVPEIVGGLNEIQKAAHGVAGAFADAVADSVHGAKDAFKAFVDYAIQELLRLAARFALFKGLTALFPGSMAAGGLLEGLFNFGGNRAYGGQVQAGQSYVVGESGAERFIPATNGTIAPAAPTFDFSSFPPASNPFAMARDAQWMRFLSESVENMTAGGYRFANG